MKKRNKKYNPHRTAIHFAKSYTKNFAMVWAGTLDAKIYNIKNNSKAILTQAKLDAMTKVAHKWQVHVAALLRDHEGDDYIQTKRLIFKQDYYSEFIGDFINDTMIDLRNSCNQQHIVNVGWVATTSDKDISDEAISEMMTDAGAWDFLSPIEAKELEVQ